ncbi:unnamed protein product [Rotaria sordida]|uniref:Uncharacterized protein n=1 Tax=Rotaria sordida TaxID=392033 RepID=A0A815FYE1_9BILA|nr:unnamed protein product [Rotaria sordida]CAF1331580.1 unnamed protein product [Rotaria sordida]
MDIEADWVFLDNNDEFVIEPTISSIVEKMSEQDNDTTTKLSYAAVLLKNANENQHQTRSVMPIVEKKEKLIDKRNDNWELSTSCLEPKPGSQFRNPRDKAGTNKVHKNRNRSSSPPRKIGNSKKTGCTFCNPRIANRIARTRDVRAQCSRANWKDYD